jgi:hypothetical protein
LREEKERKEGRKGGKGMEERKRWEKERGKGKREKDETRGRSVGHKV